MKHVWLDCDPGHDDACAILLATSLPSDINLVGLSTVHGNASGECTLSNAIRLIHMFSPQHDALVVHPGAPKPLIRPSRADPEIHGPDGLGGVVGLPPLNHPVILSRLESSHTANAVEGLAAAAKLAISSGYKIHLVATGPLTNLALFISVYPYLLSAFEEVCFMGGGVGIGNRGAVAEFNILCDPEAAQIVVDAPIRKTMIPLNVTHKAIVTETLQRRLLNECSERGLSNTTTPLRHTLHSIVSYFAASYKSVFGFNDGPPLHDALTIAYVARPELFRATRYRVDVDCISTLGTGQTVVDAFNYRDYDDSWGSTGKNVLVAEGIDVPAFFELFFECVDRCDTVSRLNLAA
ncbi:nucleoside hydrolase [Cantharellus anzutake]|uniref:nucleoside hydrolase n=1 Tax=Cantharellus anzutake TaxID=1750568 RepID=UPI0019077902|nr:nucleoside hydrolase [Cantharellus anzutake]KAF8325557.1 nucleoside hydrolase [Cantharellus anzutake]